MRFPDRAILTISGYAVSQFILDREREAQESVVKGETWAYEKEKGQAMVVHAFNLSMWEAEAGRFL